MCMGHSEGQYVKSPHYLGSEVLFWTRLGRDMNVIEAVKLHLQSLDSKYRQCITLNELHKFMARLSEEDTTPNQLQVLHLHRQDIQDLYSLPDGGPQ